MLTAHIYKVEVSSLGPHWVCRLNEPGGYVWHGQVAHTSFKPDATRESFVKDCRAMFGALQIAPA